MKILAYTKKTDMDRQLITSVMGFDFETVLIDSEGKEVGKGFKTIVPERTAELPSFLSATMRDTRWFDHHNDKLLEKIKAFRKLNE